MQPPEETGSSLVAPSSSTSLQPSSDHTFLACRSVRTPGLVSFHILHRAISRRRKKKTRRRGVSGGCYHCGSHNTSRTACINGEKKQIIVANRLKILNYFFVWDAEGWKSMQIKTWPQSSNFSYLSRYVLFCLYQLPIVFPCLLVCAPQSISFI